jgi:serine/threonine protein kinase
MAHETFDSERPETKPNPARDDTWMLDQRLVGSVHRGKDLISKHYKLGKELGRGAFAVVVHAISRSNKRPHAVKLISKSRSGKFSKAALEAEIAILKSIDHPNCMRLYGVYDEPHRTCLVLELIAGSNLRDRVQKDETFFTEPTAAHITNGIMSALRFLHSMLIVHRDLKPENLMFASDSPKSSGYLTIVVCDLGLGYCLSSASSRISQRCGTPNFMAPEILQV